MVKQSLVVEGFPLGRWLSKQRHRWDQLTDEQRSRLSVLPGWTLDARGIWWEEGFQHLQDYVSQYGTMLPLRLSEEHNGYSLGQWVGNQRTRWKTLSAERQQRLSDTPGWTMDARAARWEEGFHLLEDFAQLHGTSRLPNNKHIYKGFKLGIWVNTQRQNWDTLPEDGKKRLLALPGWTTNSHQARWDEGYQYLLKYVESEGNATVRTACVFEGYKLGQWVTVQRTMYRKGALKPEREAELTKLNGWIWNPRRGGAAAR